MKEVGSAYSGDGYFLQCFFLLKYRHMFACRKKKLCCGMPYSVLYADLPTCLAHICELANVK